MSRAGFIGLGYIGEPIAKRLVANPDGLIVFDVRPEAVDALVEAGAQRAASLQDVAANAEVICVMVRDDAQVREVVGELLPHVAPDTIIVIHSTIDASTAIELAATAASQDVAVLDAAVSGGILGASSGTLAVLVGGDEAAVERARPVLSHYATLITRFGDVGAGTKAKLARNIITFVAYAAVAEAQHIAAAAGLDLVKLGEVVRHSDAATGGPGAIMHRTEVGPIDPDDFWYGPIGNAVSLGEKDMTLARELAASLGVDTPMTEAALEHLAPAFGVPHSEYWGATKE